MTKYYVTALIEYTYTVEADSEEEAEDKAKGGEFEEADYGGWHQTMSIEND